jgi:hypothetical protein
MLLSFHAAQYFRTEQVPVCRRLHSVGLAFARLSLPPDRICAGNTFTTMDVFGTRQSAPEQARIADVKVPA